MVKTKLDLVRIYVMGNLNAGEDLIAKVQTKIKNRAAELSLRIAVADSREAFSKFCTGWKKVPQDQLDAILELATATGAEKVRQAVLEYKQQPNIV
jgi:hypothetical protein